MASPPPSESPLEELLESVRAALHAQRAELSQRVTHIEGLLRDYERATERELALKFASEHGLKQVAKGSTAVAAARALSNAVQALPELESKKIEERVSVQPPTAPIATRATPIAAPALQSRIAKSGKLVIIGAISGREKGSSLPPELAGLAEWIDTERDGVHAVGNLPQRIRQGRVSGVVILDRVVQHKHTEPVIAAARDAKVPVAFAGQGGKASLARAVAQLEEMLGERE
jgi:hypothetical protein